jgi:hypothetical protein
MRIAGSLLFIFKKQTKQLGSLNVWLSESSNTVVKHIKHSLAERNDSNWRWKWLAGVVLFSQISLSLPADTNSGVDAAVASLPLRETVRTGLKLEPQPAAALTLHVSPTGSDSQSGSAEKPFSSLERARQEIRALRRIGTLKSGGVDVIVHGGEYPVSRTFALGAEDSGAEKAPIRYRAASGEKPLLRGGVRVKGWRPLSATGDFRQVPAESRDKVWIADLKSAGVTNLMPLKLGGSASGNGSKTHPAHELFFNGKAMQLARGPNHEFLHIAGVAVKDGTKGYDREGSKVGKFFYQGDWPSKWKSEPDLLLYGYWFWDWADSYERVAGIDTEQKMITLAEPWHGYGYSVGAPFYAVNALCELDAPGEWYLDRASGSVLLYPPSDPTTATVELSQFAAPMVKLENTSYVQFEGLTWELGSADAIQVRGGSNCLFAGCTVRRFAGNGIEIRDGGKHGLVSCDIYSMGRGGTILSGGNRKTLAPGGHYIENCDIYDLSRIDHTYTPAVLLEGVGNRLAHNRFHEVLSSALRVEGNDHVVEYNEVYSVVTESDDQGAVDMFGNPTYRGNVYRYNYWHHVGNWRASGNQPKCGQAGIRLDDAICGTLIFGNIFERCSTGKSGFGGVQIHGGKDNIVENNLFVDCAAVISFTPWDLGRWQNHVKSALDAKTVDRELYLQRYPELAQLAEKPNVNYIRRNVALRCGELFRHGPKTAESINNTMLTEGDFTMQPGCALFNRPGFDAIPVDEIGLYKDAWRSR